MPKKSKKKGIVVKTKSADTLLLERIRAIFLGAGFAEFDTDKKKIEVKNWGSDIDRTFVCENVIVICERTTTSDPWAHLKPKVSFFSAVNAEPESCVQALCAIDADLGAYVTNSAYSLSQFALRIVYVSETEISLDHQALAPFIQFLHEHELRFFQHLIKCVRRSGKYELLRFLQVSAKEFGKGVASGQSVATKQYEGFLLPTEHSSLPKKHDVISFYADPQFLLETCYVLRKDGWEDDSSLYQRLLAPKKLRAMRKYLATQERVYVNNIIVTLPSETTVTPYAGQHGGAKRVKVQIPHGFNSTAVIDGQHRIFCYFEGEDAEEEKIKKMRVKQNLLVTGISFPPETKPGDRARFEATLFLEINSNQTGAKTALKQDIAVLLSPASNAAIAKRVIAKLNRTGPLERLMRLSDLDPKELIASSSMVTYGLIPLVKLDGPNSLFVAWMHSDKGQIETSDHVREEYIMFCVDKINEFLAAARFCLGKEIWYKKHTPASNGILTQTLLTACLVCLRRIVEAQVALSFDVHKQALKDLPTVKFDDFKRSSLWKKLGDKIFEVCYDGIA